MFHRYGKKGKSSQTRSLKDLTRIIASSLLLGEEKRSVLLRQIKESCALGEARFDGLCISLVHNLVNHCQNLPETSTSYYSQPGGLVDHALNRTEAALNLFQNFLIQDSQDGLSEEQKLWQYALFSAAILQGIGKLQTDFSVDLFDGNGQFLKQWNPLLESLVAVGHYYGYQFQKETDEAFRRRLNILIARFLMPAGGFAWIASNPDVLAVWLALLNEDTEGAGTLGAILIRADAIAIQRYLSQLGLKGGYGSGRGGRYGRISTFTDRVPESIAEKEQQIGIEFIQWLTNSLKSGLIMINKAPLFMVPGGLLICAEMWDMFMKNNPQYNSIQAIRNGFLSLGMHHIGADGNVIFRFEQSSNQQMHSGIIFENYAVALPEEVQLHNISTGKVTTISATELIYQAQFNSSYFTSKQAIHSASPMLHLNSSGRWVAENPALLQASPRPGVLTSV
ncbi:TraI domain-containing protein [Legionella micdadei]|uniref:Integrating conjugative element relaxase, PFL_4751 family n=1 Tax=Legionella micdadei TaxID=451 RepID=A0A098GK06_LEGMI|nr:TraI domain-containing protein [Legionella micdadei]ARG98724.1 helicase [Legionella micdadei]ARH01443.1 helicase [Legionella micdadei]KTD28941.1 putative helicase/relaxase [Legionella micdadei]NSL17153.1 TraI domain-containing protein [Legionella micdadei]CEG62322.1 putative helicase/relaxase [Legionella micdadei]